MAKLSLTASATFKATVKIPVAGGKASPVEFTFNAMTKTKLKAWPQVMGDKDDTEVIMEIASGWDLDDPFNADNVARLNDQYIGAAKVILETYIDELSTARLGN